jgi:2-phosphosulfolactate phosphatase
MKLTVHFLPALADPHQLAGATVVVADVLRATTTMLAALWSGARAIIPCLEIEDALRVAGSLRGDAVLGGERGGRRIPGFQLGNSPAEYTPAAVSGKTVVLTTTNGTRALQACRAARRVLLGAFVNISSLVDELARADDLVFLCAGTDGQVTCEDVLLAGAAVRELQQRMPGGIDVNDQGQLAGAAWQSMVGALSRTSPLADALRHSRGGLNLRELGFESDIELAAQVDAMPVIGELLPGEWRVAATSRPDPSARPHC